jgi:hypothetical protein
MTMRGVPDGLPVLSRGKHRNPRQGACFMEMASLLANEPWSDRPRCTHPLLAQLARLVNDHTSDAGRAELVVMIPEVIGVRGQGLEWEVALVAAVAAQAVYDAPEPKQRALAAGLLRCDELAERHDATGVDRAAIAAALERVPGAATWARSFVGGAAPLKPRAFQRHSAPAVLLCAVRGTAEAAISDPDAQLRGLLRTGLDTARRTGTAQSIGRSSSAYETDWRRRRPSAPTAY